MHGFKAENGHKRGCNGYVVFPGSASEAYCCGHPKTRGGGNSSYNIFLEYYDAGTLINNRTFTVPLTGGETRSIPVEVVWNYRGTYGGTYLDTIECGGNITLSR